MRKINNKANAIDAYITNPDKANITYVKNAFRDMLGKNDASGNFILSNAGEEIFDVIWNNSSLKLNIFGSSMDKLQVLNNFRDLLKNTNTTFFSFIK